ncbi:glyoxylate/hydroxypyruvate reductase HPR3-like [Eucalyptus grandis]|uniref:glyoxylate/hydroxypyruvate reductase HPR3-like n=1 Tax=Eucalyptus grandis TaxID=71139 RepID=UPI0005261CDE|nr:glyoxylate/hydroxypyruvate reductase HPR3-like [Eucalyptus grandis]
MASHPQNNGAPPPLNRHPPPPCIRLLWHPTQFSILDRPLPDTFRFLNPWESPLPLSNFLSSTDAGATKAILTSGMSPITTDMLWWLPEVRLVITTSAGLKHIDLAKCRRRGIVITNTGDTYSEDTADLATTVPPDWLT